MADFQINKGIGRSVEFKGLKSQYLFIFAGGLLGVFIVVIILYMIGVNQYFCLLLGIAGSSVLIWQTFSLNEKYGEYGLMKKSAQKSQPDYLSRQRSVPQFIKMKRQ